jgi:competence protein ComEC
MDKSLVQAYMDTGSMHVLAVSGLHVSMLAVMVQGILALGGRGLRKGSWWTFGLSNLGIWFFALLAGGSASVLRAALMFSLQQLGQQVQRQSNSYNTLALSGLILLCYQPQFLWDLGFLLSFLAVWGILYWYKPIYNLVYFQNKYWDWLWQMTAVSLAAQMATLPLCLYYFHQFPLLFWLAGWLILPLLSVLMPLALLVLALGGLPYLGDLLGLLLYWGLWLMNAATLGVQAIPYSVLTQLWFSAWSMGFLALTVGAFSFWLLLREERKTWLSIGLGCLFLFNLSHGLSRWQANGQRILVLLYHPKGLHLDLLQGRQGLSLSDSLALADSSRLAQQQKNYLGAWQIQNHQHWGWPKDKTLIWGEAWLAGSLLHWGEQKILFYQAHFSHPDWQPPIKQVEVLVIKDAWRLSSLKPMLERLSIGQIVLHPSNPRRKRQQWILEAEQEGIPCWDMQTQGSWVWKA